MAVEVTNKPEVSWSQGEFERIKAGWPRKQAAKDEKALKKIFALAAKSPLLAEELAWAEQHGVKFFIDHQAVNCGGYYLPGTGVMAITPKMAENPETAVEVLAHEIRHVWQDYHGLLTTRTKDFTEGFIKLALIEADAHAHGMVARRQYMTAYLKKRFWIRGRRRWLKDFGQDTDFGKHFLSWFSTPSKLKYYGDQKSKHFGRLYGLLPANSVGGPRNCQLKTGKVMPMSNFNINNVEDVLPLGMNFSGTENYLAALQPDILPKKILRPSLADTFWGAANDDQRKLTTELRKAHLRKKRANKPPRHAWP